MRKILMPLLRLCAGAVLAAAAAGAHAGYLISQENRLMTPTSFFQP